MPQTQRPALVNRATLILGASPIHVTNPPVLSYYFHPDHLGSSSYMSGNGGSILQHMEYLPFGEAMMDEHINSRNNPFKYNGKHLDEETGNYYYGARYYDPKLSNFISVDPLAVKTFSSYRYCYNNPIVLVDPDGKAPEDFTILIARDGAGGKGHMASIVQDSSGNYYYVTMGGAEAAGISKMASQGIQGGMVVQKLEGAKNMSEAISMAKQDTNNSPYTDHVTFKTDSKTDGAIFSEVMEKANGVNSGNDKYNLLFNNCTDACERPIESATGISLPNDATPNDNFKKVKDNKNEIQGNLNYIKNKIDNTKIKEEKNLMKTVKDNIGS